MLADHVGHFVDASLGRARRDQRRLVAERARVEDHRDLPDDLVLLQGRKPPDDVVLADPQLVAEERERSRLEREGNLDQVQKFLVDLVQLARFHGRHEVSVSVGEPNGNAARWPVRGLLAILPSF
ncbi:MAG: hypothetical protein E6G46_04315 [Actinobacteria bacterium]|nr:MAG: hypothetical protein E6G46_04315 [Actinomycetota bacterium]